MKLIYEVMENKYYNVKEVLKAHFHISDRLLTKLKKSKQIYLNNIPVYVAQKIQLNDIVEVNIDFYETSDNIVPIQMKLNIIFEDEALLIINKPAGIPVHPSQNYYTNSLSNGVKYYFNENNLNKKIRPVNRLDKDTSGIVIFAKNEYIQEALVSQMKNNFFKKEYIAILEGNLTKNTGTINAPIARKAHSIMEREISEIGETAISHFELIENKQEHCIVKYTLETGRTHQLRVHSKYIGHPIVGDTLYGKSSPIIQRQALHAYKISFIHPLTKKHISLQSPIPEDMKSFNINI